MIKKEEKSKRKKQERKKKKRGGGGGGKKRKRKSNKKRATCPRARPFSLLLQSTSPTIVNLGQDRSAQIQSTPSHSRLPLQTTDFKLVFFITQWKQTPHRYSTYGLLLLLDVKVWSSSFV